ncbi:hypothetical protein R50073_04160 [Maricurvus nonylphenolicus]|uniref:YfiR family protein n=1 Tax=Maricurvus nonylphenolicus TaxID=1008307 RepID=UPI0036F3F803
MRITSWLAGGRTLGLSLSVLLSILQVAMVEARAGVADTQEGREIIGHYIYYFARNVDWPETVFKSSGSPFWVCMVGKESLGLEVSKRLQKGRVGRHRIRLKHFNLDQLGGLRQCQIVFIDETHAHTIKEIIKPLDNLPILTVSDAEGFAAQGGMVGFVGRGKQVAMQLNRTVIERAQLKLGALLQ